MKHCCDLMTYYVNHDDHVVYFWEEFTEYLIPIHDGGSSGVLIRYCPWCGTELPDSERDEVLGVPESERTEDEFAGDGDPGRRIRI